MKALAKQIMEKMLLQDLFSQWLGITCLDASQGSCSLRMTIRQEMCNGFGIAHGGIAYSFADSALAFASNSHGRKALSIETSVSHLKQILVGETLVAIATEMHLSHRIGIYEIIVAREEGEKVALFKGTVYRKEEQWEV